MPSKQATMKVKKGDTVLVISGSYVGQKGQVIAAYPETRKILVEGVNRIKKHTKLSQSRGSQTGGIVTQEAPIHVSKVMVLDSEGNATRVGHRKDDNGRSVRVSRRNGKDLA